MHRIEWERIKNKIEKELAEEAVVTYGNIRNEIANIIGTYEGDDGSFYAKYDDKDYNQYHRDTHHMMTVEYINLRDCREKTEKCLKELGYVILHTTESNNKINIFFKRSDGLKENIFYIITNGEDQNV